MLHHGQVRYAIISDKHELLRRDNGEKSIDESPGGNNQFRH